MNELSMQADPSVMFKMIELISLDLLLQKDEQVHSFRLESENAGR